MIRHLSKGQLLVLDPRLGQHPVDHLLFEDQGLDRGETLGDPPK